MYKSDTKLTPSGKVTVFNSASDPYYDMEVPQGKVRSRFVITNSIKGAKGREGIVTLL